MSNDNDISGEDDTLGERGSPVLPAVSTALVVEDDPDMREVLALVLSDEGYRVVTAAHGAAALNVLDEVEPDVVILDLMMPVMTGWDVLDVLERTGRADDFALVVFSSSELGPNHRDLPVVEKHACPTTLLSVIRAECDRVRG